jgi:hypothetical protein
VHKEPFILSKEEKVLMHKHLFTEYNIILFDVALIELS